MLHNQLVRFAAIQECGPDFVPFEPTPTVPNGMGEPCLSRFKQALGERATQATLAKLRQAVA